MNTYRAPAAKLLSDSLLDRLATNVSRLRIKAGLTQEQLAELANISARNLQRIERGRVDLRASAFVALSDALHVSVDELFRVAIPSIVLDEHRFRTDIPPPADRRSYRPRTADGVLANRATR
jgi:transcriptional regulator with XRE-family HTH domain